MGEYARDEIMRTHGVDIGNDYPVAYPAEPRNHGKPWTDELDRKLLVRWRAHSSVRELLALLNGPRTGQ